MDDPVPLWQVHFQQMYCVSTLLDTNTRVTALRAVGARGEAWFAYCCERFRTHDRHYCRIKIRRVPLLKTRWACMIECRYDTFISSTVTAQVRMIECRLWQVSFQYKYGLGTKLDITSFRSPNLSELNWHVLLSEIYPTFKWEWLGSYHSDREDGADVRAMASLLFIVRRGDGMVVIILCFVSRLSPRWRSLRARGSRF